MNVPHYVQLYPLLLSLAILAGLWICERRSHNVALFRKTYVIGACAGIVGARLWYAAQYGGLGITGGLSIWGFMMGACAGIAGYLCYKPAYWFKLADFPDAAAPAIALGVALQRVGCFFAGCCFGKVTSLPWAVCYKSDAPVFQKQVLAGIVDPSSLMALPVHPTQLYESVVMILTFFALLWIQRSFGNKLLHHELFLGLALYGSAFRFLLEYIRDDAWGRHFGPLTFAQGTSLAIFLVAGSLLVARRLQHRHRETIGDAC